MNTVIELLDSNNLYHCDDGPALVYSNGSKLWYRHGRHHRDDGPALEWSNGHRAWYLDGVEYSYVMWYIKMNPNMSEKERVLLVLKHG